MNELTAQEPLDQDISPLVLKRVLSALILMLSPMTPHIAEEMWQMLGNSDGISVSGPSGGSAAGSGAAGQKWPRYREDLTREEQIEIIIQINGRVRGKMLVEAELGEDETRERALHDPRIAPLVAGKQIGEDYRCAEKVGEHRFTVAVWRGCSDANECARRIDG